MNRFKRPRSLTELVTEHLRTEIVSGALDFGAALSEATIAQRLDVSRTPVREAFQRLEIEGLVRSEPQRGTFVFSTSKAELKSLCDVRIVLETGAIHLAIKHDGLGLIKRLGAVIKRMEKEQKAGNIPAYLHLDHEYHQALIDGAANIYLDQAYQTIAPRMAALRNRLGAHPDLIEKSYREHCEIRDLIANGDIDDALRILELHIGRKEGSYWNL